MLGNNGRAEVRLTESYIRKEQGVSMKNRCLIRIDVYDWDLFNKPGRVCIGFRIKLMLGPAYKRLFFERSVSVQGNIFVR